MQNKIVAPGRKGIEESVYINQIQAWLNDNYRIKDITATLLQKTVGGNYNKAVNILNKFKEGYETKELSDLPSPPEEFINAINAAGLDAWRIIYTEKEKEIIKVKEYYEQQNLEIKNISEEYLSKINEQEAYIEQHIEKNQLLQIEFDKLKEDLTILSETHNETNIALSQTLERSSQLEKQNTIQVQQINELTEKDKKTSDNLADLNKKHSRTEAQVIYQQKQVDDLSAKLNNEVEEYKLAQAQITELRENNSALRQSEQNNQQQIESYINKLETGEDELKAAVIENTKLNEGLAAKKSEIEILNNNLKLSTANNEKLQNQLIKLANK